MLLAAMPPCLVITVGLVIYRSIFAPKVMTNEVKLAHRIKLLFKKLGKVTTLTHIDIGAKKNSLGERGLQVTI